MEQHGDASAVSPVIAEELIVPGWRNGKSYASVLGREKVESEIRNCLVAAGESNGLESSRAASQLESHFDSLKNAIRISDLKDGIYWIVMSAVCFCFLIIEIIAVITASVSDENLSNFLIFAFSLMAIAFLSMTSHVWLMYRAHRGQSIPNFLSPGLIHAAPVFLFSLGILLMNFWLVWETGLRQSPFLAAFLSAALAVIGLPRENSAPIMTLTVIALALGLYVCLVGHGMSPEEFKQVLDTWNAGENGVLPFYINAATLIVSVILSIVLRAFSFKVGCCNA